MKTLFSIVLALPLSAVLSWAQPVVNTVANAASYSPAPLPNSPIALGSFFAIFGTGLGPAVSSCGAGLQDCIWAPYPLPTSIQGASVTITTGTNAPVNAYIYFAIDSQINAVMPSTVKPGTGTLTVTYNGTSAPVPITVTESSFGTFTQNEAGSGPGIFFDINNTTHVGTVNSFANTATPGQYITLYGTGLGAPADLADEGSQAPQFPDDFTQAPHNLAISVWVGGKPATIAYAGRSQYTALDQINFVVPSGIQGCHLQVAIQVTPPGGAPIVSNFTSLSVDPLGAPCQDSDGVSLYSLAPLLQSKGSVNVGVIGLQSLSLIDVLGTPEEWNQDTVTAGFGTFTTAMVNTFQGFAPMPAVNDCTVSPYFYFTPPVDPALASLQYLNAGPALTIQGPNGMIPIPLNSNGLGYSALLGGTQFANILNLDDYTQAYFLDQVPNTDGSGTFTTTGVATGSYSVTGPGGTAVGPMTAPISISSAAGTFSWTNESIAVNSSYSAPISRSQPLTLTWTGGDPQGYVGILIVAMTSDKVTPDNSSAAMVAQCTASTSAGSFTVPSYVMQSVPDAFTTNSSVDFPALLMVGPTSGIQKVSPVPSGLDALYIYYSLVRGAAAVFE